MKKILIILAILVCVLVSCKMEREIDPLVGLWEMTYEGMSYRLDLRSDGWATYITHENGVVNSIESYQWYADETFIYTLGQFNHYQYDKYSCDGNTLIYGAMTYTRLN